MRLKVLNRKKIIDDVGAHFQLAKGETEMKSRLLSVRAQRLSDLYKMWHSRSDVSIPAIIKEMTIKDVKTSLRTAGQWSM